MKTLVGIGITTKNRWKDLAFTLARVEEFWGSKYAIIVIDDGSDTPVPEETLRQFPRVRFERSPQSLGPTGQRNRICHLLATDFVLGLDDDSYPIRGDLEEAIEWMQGDTSIFALSFTTIENMGSHPLADQQPKIPYPCQYFIGCSHLLNRKMFLALGGYDESFVICQEETDLALRALRAGLQVVHYPDFIIRHNPSKMRRSLDRNNFLIIRNEILIGFASFPLFYLFFRCTWYPIRTWLEKFTSFKMCLKATMEAFSMAPRVKRNPLSYEKYKRWKKLPRPCYLQEGKEMGQNRFYRMTNAPGGA